jgi:hypothetical protein
MRLLKRVKYGARTRITTEFRLGIADADFTEYVEQFDRDVDIDPLNTLVDEAMRQFSDDREASDAWLSPRIHAALRLTRREAGDRRLWEYLSLVEFPDYVRWRFPGKPNEGTAPERFVGAEYKHAIARLWWGAEQTRNGRDYGPVVQLFGWQDLQNTWLHYRAMHNRPAALAAIRFLSTFKDGKKASSDQVNELGPALNFALTTTVLDSVAPDRGTDPIAIEDWVHGSTPEVDLLSEKLPIGPDDEPASEEAIRAVEEMLSRLATDIDLENLSRARRRRREAKEPEAA